MVDFAGWNMPVQYASIIDEHHLTRKAVGLFDIAHMARFECSGPRVNEWLDGIVTRRVKDLSPGQVRYALVCNAHGGVLDDVLVTRLPSGSGLRYLVVANAGNRDKIALWLEALLQEGVEFKDRSDATVMIAVQGPHAWKLTESVLNIAQGNLPYYHARLETVEGEEVIVSRTGYTGEDGCELIASVALGTKLWEKLADGAAKLGGGPVGLGARDTLRLEAGMPLYGHELSEEITPWQAGLDFAVNLKDRKFIGHDVLAERRSHDVSPIRVGFRLVDKRIARQGAKVLCNGREVGVVTSGAFCPTLGESAGMAMVERAFGAPGAELQIDIRGKAAEANVTAIPFYKRSM